MTNNVLNKLGAIGPSTIMPPKATSYPRKLPAVQDVRTLPVYLKSNLPVALAGSSGEYVITDPKFVGPVTAPFRDAPVDGRLYGRKNAAWTEASGGGGSAYAAGPLYALQSNNPMGAFYGDSNLTYSPTTGLTINPGKIYNIYSKGLASMNYFEGSMTVENGVTLGDDPTESLQAATKQYVDNKTIPDAPNDGLSYGRQSANWSRVLAITGDILDGGNF